MKEPGLGYVPISLLLQKSKLTKALYRLSEASNIMPPLECAKKETIELIMNAGTLALPPLNQTGSFPTLLLFTFLVLYW